MNKLLELLSSKIYIDNYKYSKAYDCLGIFDSFIRIYLLPQGSQLCVLKGHGDKISFFEYVYRDRSQYIEYIISSGYDNIIRINSFPACRIVRELKYHSNAILVGFLYIPRSDNI